MTLLGKHLPKLLTTIACTGMLATAPAALAAGATHDKAHVTRAARAHISCATIARSAHTARSVRARRRARAAARSCHTITHKTTHARSVHPHKKPVSNGTTIVVKSPQEVSAQIAAVLATPCQNTELTPEAGNLALVRGSILCLINQVRAQNGRSPLSANPKLEQAAESHCAELIADDYFAHISPSGETPVQRIEGTGYIPGPSVGYAIGENLAWGTLSLSTPRAIVTAWVASPEHLANILEGQYTETGIGVSDTVPSSLGEGQPGATYAQEFGVIIR